MVSITVSLTVFVTLALVTFGPSSYAFITGAQWKNLRTLYYGIDPAINTRIHGSAVGITQDVGAKWNLASFLNVARAASYSSNANGVTFFDYSTGSIPPGCSEPAPNDVPGRVCVEPTDTTTDITRARMYLNSSSSWHWNDQGSMDQYNYIADVRTVVLHEFGHMFELFHDCGNHPEAVMCPQATNAKWDLKFDDTHGATIMYGPYTGWEPGFAVGDINRVNDIDGVTGYTSSTPPELSPVAAEFGVPVPSQSKYERFAGSATKDYAYAYMRLFTGDADNGPFRNYLEIVNGMKLHWLQYNYHPGQTTISLDLETISGTKMRDTNIVDQNGVRVHPAFRGVYPAGQWLYFEVDLSPLAGQKVWKWLIAYDNGNNQHRGQFRAYIDDVRISR
jgi:hypothetical protein